MTTDLLSPFKLNDSIELQNRVLMAPLTRCMSDDNLVPTQAMVDYYACRADAGLIISEATIIRPDAQGYPNTPGLFTSEQIQGWKKVTDAVHAKGGKMFAQLWHVGRVAHPHFFGGDVLAPSAIGVEGSVPRMRELTYVTPKAATIEDIQGLIADYAKAAENAIEAGFDGVEIHAAHGYLLTQFLSPLTNQRQDEWGGSIINRARLLINIVSQIRAVCPSGFIVMVKLNSADFQRNGFSFDDACEVVRRLEALGVDVVELSGGSYEAPAMQGQTRDDTTLAREAYFLEFAHSLETKTDIPLMTTGGIKRAEVAEKVIQQGCSLVGLASALAITPDLAKKWQQEWRYSGVIPHCTWKDKSLASLANMAMVRRQLRRLGNNLTTLRSPSPLWSLVLDMMHRKSMTKRDVNAKNGSVQLTHQSSNSDKTVSTSHVRADQLNK